MPDRATWGARLRVIGQLLDRRRAHTIDLTFQPTFVVARGQRSDGWSLIARYTLTELDLLVAEPSTHSSPTDPPASSWDVWLRVLGQQFDDLGLRPGAVWSDDQGLHWHAEAGFGRPGGGSTWKGLAEENRLRQTRRKPADPSPEPT